MAKYFADVSKYFADVFNSDLFATCQVAKYNRFPPHLVKNFDFKVKGNIASYTNGLIC